MAIAAKKSRLRSGMAYLERKRLTKVGTDFSIRLSKSEIDMGSFLSLLT